MRIFLTTLLGTLSSMFRSRAVLEFEKLGSASPNWCASAVREKTPEIDPSGPPVVGLAVPPLERLAFSPGHRQARNGRGLSSCRLSPVLDLEGAARLTGTTGDFPRDPRPDPPDVPGESRLGCSPRIHGELLKLGIDIGETSVSKFMVRYRRPPSQIWRTSWTIASGSWSPSTSSPCPSSVSRSCTCFWSWPMSGGAYCTAM